MKVSMLGRKVGMTQIYRTDGTAVPVTVLECGPCTVLRVRTLERDGYDAVQLAYAPSSSNGAARAANAKRKKGAGVPGTFLREIRHGRPVEVSEGQVLTVDVFGAIRSVDVIGTSKRRGYSRVLKRHGSRGLRAMHDVGGMPRHPGDSGPGAGPSRDPEGGRKPAARPSRVSPFVTSRSSESTSRTIYCWCGGLCPGRMAVSS